MSLKTVLGLIHLPVSYFSPCPGIGVDDMFVIMGSLNNLKAEEKDLEIPLKIAQVLRHAGVSITVTSLTDFVAFMVGATTVSDDIIISWRMRQTGEEETTLFRSYFALNLERVQIFCIETTILLVNGILSLEVF